MSMVLGIGDFLISYRSLIEKKYPLPSRWKADVYFYDQNRSQELGRPHNYDLTKEEMSEILCFLSSLQQVNEPMLFNMPLGWKQDIKLYLKWNKKMQNLMKSLLQIK